MENNEINLKIYQNKTLKENNPNRELRTFLNRHIELYGTPQNDERNIPESLCFFVQIIDEFPKHFYLNRRNVDIFCDIISLDDNNKNKIYLNPTPISMNNPAVLNNRVLTDSDTEYIENLILDIDFIGRGKEPALDSERIECVKGTNVLRRDLDLDKAHSRAFSTGNGSALVIPVHLKRCKETNELIKAFVFTCNNLLKKAGLNVEVDKNHSKFRLPGTYSTRGDSNE